MTKTRNTTSGQMVNSLTSVQTNVPCMVVYRAGKNEYQNSQYIFEDRVDFKIRFDATITEKYIVSHDGAWYEIHDINNLGRKDGMQLTCKRMQNALT